MLTADLLREIEKHRLELVLSLAETPRKTLEDYHGVVGQCQGLQLAIDLINNLLEQEDDHSRSNRRPSDSRPSYG